MKPILLILCLALSVSAQADVLGIKNWVAIKEMTGPIPNHPGLVVQSYAAEIARGDDKIKLLFRADFPLGAPVDLFKKNVPAGFDVSSIGRMAFRLDFNCATLVMKTVNNSGEIYQINGRRYKSKEPPFKIESGNVFARYFCEGKNAPSTSPPKLKPKS